MKKKIKQTVKNNNKEIKNLILKLNTTFDLLDLIQKRIFNFFNYDCFNFLKRDFNNIKQEQIKAMQLLKNSLSKLNHLTENIN